jgi:hypothetical protein
MPTGKHLIFPEAKFTQRIVCQYWWSFQRFTVDIVLGAPGRVGGTWLGYAFACVGKYGQVIL